MVVRSHETASLGVTFDVAVAASGDTLVVGHLAVLDLVARFATLEALLALAEAILTMSLATIDARFVEGWLDA